MTLVVVSLDCDQVGAARIVDALVEADLSPRWACPSADGWSWRKVIDAADAAHCVLFILGDRSQSSPSDLSRLGRLISRSLAAKTAIGARVVRAADGVPFGGTVYDLSGWRMSEHWWSPFLIGGLYLRDVAAAAKYKSAGRDPPPPAAPRRLLLRHLSIVFSTIILPLIAVLSFTDLAISLYSATGIADTPSQAAQAAWDRIPDGNCDAVRDFLKRKDIGELRARADKVLAATTLRPRTTIDRTPQPVAISYSPPEDAAFPNEQSARAAALSSVKEQAHDRCSSLAASTGATYRNFELTSMTHRCTAFSEGHACMVRATARCFVEQPVTTPTEWCAR